MDEPSIQLQLDLSRTVQNELATRRPLLHRLQGSSWVLQIPRPTNAIAHGARFYYNILVDPCFVKKSTSSAGWLTQSLPTLDHLQTTAALEELLRDLETLANDLRPERSRKSNVTVEDSIGKLETLVDAVAVTSLDKSGEDSFRQLHPDVPVFAPQEAARHIAALQHFRTLATIDEFGHDGCKDWRSTTALAGLPEWVGLSTLPRQEYDTNQSPTLMIAFNNYHNNSSARLAKLQALIGSGQKRLASTLPIEDEDFAEAVLFTGPGRVGHDAIPASHADPTIYPLAVVHSRSTTVGDLGVSDSGESSMDTRSELTATHHILERNFTPDKGRGFLAWLIAKAKFTRSETNRVPSRVIERAPLDIKDGESKSSRGSYLSVGESKLLM